MRERLRPARKRDLRRCHEGAADFELDLRVREEWDLAWVAGERASVEERCDRPVRRTELFAVEGCPQMSKSSPSV